MSPPSNFLTLDLSTRAAGWAFVKKNKLTRYGCLKPKVKGLSKLKYPEAGLRRIISIATQISQLVRSLEIEKIYIEEVNRGINRISQKTLDALHFFILLDLLVHGRLDLVEYIDSDGKTGWRKILNLRLSEDDRKANRKLKGSSRITKKHLCCRYIEENLGLVFDPLKESDVADAIGIALAVLKRAGTTLTPP